MSQVCVWEYESSVCVYTGAPQTYHCTFPAMIDDWRARWYLATEGATDQMMGFGFVQVSRPPSIIRSQ